MKIAILGAGNSGCALAADYSLNGHEVTLIKTSRAADHNENFEHLLKSGGQMSLDEFGELKSTRIARVTRDIGALSEAQIVIVTVQTSFHEPLISRISGLLAPGQLLLLMPGYLSTAYVLRHCADRGVITAEAQSSFIDGRIMSPGVFRVGFRNVRNPIGVFPAAARPQAEAQLNRLGTPFTYLSSVVEAALHNPNMIVHTVGAVMSIPRIEATGGDYCMYHEVFTPSVWSILEALDAEKCAVLSRLGYEPLSYVEACKLRNSIDDSRDAKAVFFDYAGMPTRAKGPITVRSRYITEDVPQGLVLLESIARGLEIPTPVASSLIELASAALGEDMRAPGRSTERLGEENIRTILADSTGT